MTAENAATSLLLVDDEPHIVNAAKLILRSQGFPDVDTCTDGARTMGLLAQKNYAAVVLDLSMPNCPGMALLQQIADEYPDLPVIILTGHNDVENAVACLKRGAYDYLVKPVDDKRFVASVRRAVEHGELRRENSALKDSLFDDTLRHAEAFRAIVTSNPDMSAIFRYLESVATSHGVVLIVGETGTGKELIARAIHTLSARRGPFVAVNIAGLDDTLFSDALFGHLKGAFTGALSARPGLLEQAEHGTVFLDEIGDLSLQSQVKLLRVLQEKEFFPLGADAARRTDARIIAATNRDLRAMARDGSFRKDLYYRLRTHQVRIPPLRSRQEDIPLLLDHFLAKAAAGQGKKCPAYPPELPLLLANHHFPGNVRELQTMIEDAVSRHQGGVLSMDSFRNAIREERDEPVVSMRSEPISTSLRIDESETHGFPTLAEAEQFLIQQALQRAKGNQGIAAHMLGISRSALNKRLHKTPPEKGL